MTDAFKKALLTSAVLHVTPSDLRQDAAARNKRVEVTIEVLANTSDSSTFSSKLRQTHLAR